MTPAQTLSRLRLARTEGVGPQTYGRLLARYGSPEAALEALPRLAARNGAAFAPPPQGEVEREMEAVARLGGRFLFRDDPGYPPLLALLDDAPPAIAVLGDTALLRQRQVALVGARNASAGARRLAEELAEALAASGLAITSGLARGVDAAAHLGALRGGRTVAVVAGGLDEPYPPEHAALQTRIAAEGGAVVAEAPLGTAPLARHFPRRNRIVAGLSLGVVVVEAALRSGSLITARMALDAWREVFAVPGSPLDPRCRGSNDLIRQGAHLVETAEDVLANLPESPRPGPPLLAPRVAAPEISVKNSPALRAGDDRGQVLALLGPVPVPVDDLMRRCHLSAPTLQAVLTDLELDGLVETLPGNRVALQPGVRNEASEGA